MEGLEAELRELRELWSPSLSSLLASASNEETEQVSRQQVELTGHGHEMLWCLFLTSRLLLIIVIRREMMSVSLLAEVMEAMRESSNRQEGRRGGGTSSARERPCTKKLISKMRG